ncbi:MAG: hypoxanthine phosphoribosyltransferase [Candidatus Eremiobacteraeota bacterium]|nr:hypoxanthine phosphoribosyltransferase [Candidatus Eremiobacteraeota bacterium]
MKMHPELAEILYTEEEMRHRIEELGKEISADYANEELIIIVLLRGAVIFLADLTRTLDINATIDFIVVTRYGYADRPGQLRIIKDLDYPIEGKHIIIVEDIVDEGYTLFQIKEALLLRKPASLKICTLFDKPARRKVAVTPDYIGFTIPNKFIVGYGLDYKQRFRNLPYLATVKDELMA